MLKRCTLTQNKFIDEKRIKMVDERTRRMALNITDNKGVVYSIFLYFREGNQRLTKAKFGQITDEIKDWCWFIAKNISPDKTGKRTVTIVQPQASAVSPSVHKRGDNQSRETLPKTKSSQINVKANHKAIVQESNHKNTAIESNNKHINTGESAVSSPNIIKQNSTHGNVDTQLIEALNKLANLKTEGFLTEDEFISAKAKILASLQKD